MFFLIYFLLLNGIFHARIAQLVEHITDTDRVPGSNPGARTNKKKAITPFFYLCAQASKGFCLRPGFEDLEYIFEHVLM